MKKVHIISIGVGVFLVTLLLLSLTDNAASNREKIDTQSTASSTDAVSASATVWRTLPLTNVQTQETFTVDDLSDKPVLLESFAVWCPSCTRQQQQIQDLHESDFGNKFYSISLNTDENEDDQKVLDHIQRNGFTGRYAIADAVYTQELIDEFSFAIVNAPSMPVVLICQKGLGTFYLEQGLKTADELKNHIVSKCGV